MKHLFVFLMLSAICSGILLKAQSCEERFQTIHKQSRQSYSEAIIAIDSLIEACQESYFQQDSVAFALAYHRKALYLFQSQQFEQAIVVNQQALDVREALTPPQAVLVGHSHINIARCYKRLFQFAEERQHLEVACRVLALESDAKRKGQAHYDMADLLLRTHDYHSAIDYLSRGISAYQSINLAPNIALGNLQMGILYTELGELEQGKSYFSQAMDQYEELAPSSPIYEQYVAKCLHNLGEVAFRMRDWEQAIDLHQQAADICQQASLRPYPSTQEILSSVFHFMAQSYTELSNLKQADIFLDSAENIIRGLHPTDDHPAFIKVADGRGDILRKQSQEKEAIQQYQKAIQLATPLFTSGNVLDNPVITDSTFFLDDQANLLIFFRSKAQTLRELASTFAPSDPHIQSALDLYRQADQLIQRMRKEHMNDGSKLFWIEHSRPLYEEAIELSYQIGDISQAYQFAEKSMASLLLTEVNNLNAKALAGISPDNLKKEQSLKSRIRTYEARLENLRYLSGKEAEIDNYQQTLSKIRIEFQNHVSDLEKQSPAYYQYKYQSSVVSLEQVQSHLKSQSDATACLQYFSGDSALYLFCILPDTAYLWQMDQPYASMQSFFQIVADTSDIANPANRDRLVLNSHELYKQLLGPIRQAEISLPQKLIIIPDGYLARIPFEALVTQLNQQSPGIAYLIRDHICRYGPSASILLNQRPYRKTASGHILGIAPIRFSKYNNLLYSEIEVKNILQLLGGRSLTLDQANKANVLEQIANYRVLHFSTHAQASSDRPPFIAFSDTNLLLPEIYSLETRAEMVALSACETLLGDEKKGEGIMSLARAFQFIGVPSLAASLWQVSDRSTQLIMTDFYRYLAEGMGKDEALHQAKIDYLDQHGLTHQAPFYWAPIVLVGDHSDLSFQSPGMGFMSWMFIGIALIILVIGVLIWRKKS